MNFVLEQDGRLIGQNMFMRTIINADNGREIPVLTMGPIGITPELKRRGRFSERSRTVIEQPFAKLSSGA